MENLKLVAFTIAVVTTAFSLHRTLRFSVKLLTGPFYTAMENSPSEGSPLTIACLSDTHGLHLSNKLEVPDADVLVFAGDAGLATKDSIESFNTWLGTLPHEHKIMVYGNMDYATERSSFEESRQLSNATAVLTDSYIEIEGYMFYGTPFTPKFCGGYQLKDETTAERHWEKAFNDIPKIDVLITHGPPFGVGDETGGRHVGDAALKSSVDSWQFPPRVWICGHVHASHGLHSYPHPKGPVPLVNSAVWYLDGEAIDKAQPFLIELPSLRVWRNRDLLTMK